MNLYLVVSELLTEVVWEDWFNHVGHEESYRIAELVVARSHAQARWLAWKSDSKGVVYPCVEDMPKFAVRLKKHGVGGPPRIVSDDFDKLGFHGPRSEGIAELWWLGNAPHIGIVEETT